MRLGLLFIIKYNNKFIETWQIRKMRALDTIQLNRQKLNSQWHPAPKKQFVCLYGKMNMYYVLYCNSLFCIILFFIHLLIMYLLWN